MGVWYPSISLAGDEKVRFESLANSFQGRRSIGGRLMLTDRRLIFIPGRLGGVTGGRRRTILLSDIRDVSREKSGRSAVKQRGLAAAVRPQVVVEPHSGPALVVTVRRTDDLLRLLADPSRL